MKERAKRRGGLSAAVLALGLLAAGVPWLTGCGGGRGADRPSDMPMERVGPYRVGVRNMSEPPSVGDNAMTVVVRDAEGKPLKAAEVRVVVSMAAMGAMPYMESRGQTKEVQPGVYRADYGLSMNGEWDVSILIRPKQGPDAEAAFRLSTSLKGLAFAGGTPAAGDSATGAAGTVPGDRAPEIPGAILLDAARRQAMGVRTAPVRMRDLVVTIRAVGQVAYDERRQSVVALRYSGWVRDIHVDYTGRAVRRGEVLFTAYSPELWAAQQEFLAARSGGFADTVGGPTGTAGSPLAQAAATRLRLLDVPASEIRRLETTGRAREAIPVVAPGSGVVTEKMVVQGSPFTAGQVLYRIASVDPVWVTAGVFQVDLPLVRTGMRVRLVDPYLDERSRWGRVSFIAPTLEAETRTGQVRIEAPNAHGALKPGAFVNVELEASLGYKLAVPESAVIPTGERRVVFIDLGDGRLAPRDVRLGHRAGDFYEVLAGLTPGDVVVTSGNFLVASDSRLKSASQKW
ncbi:MAG: efflux RND transporter periplasmic adaptor subunit [Candidatus Eisenbacteria bacterium]